MCKGCNVNHSCECKNIVQYEIYWKDLNSSAKKKLKAIYHANINIAPLAIIEIEKEGCKNE